MPLFPNEVGFFPPKFLVIFETSRYNEMCNLRGKTFSNVFLNLTSSKMKEKKKTKSNLNVFKLTVDLR